MDNNYVTKNELQRVVNELIERFDNPKHIITSCDRCGVVLDQDYLVYCPAWSDDGEVAHEDTVYEDGYYYVTAPCPVCENRIRREHNE